MPKLRRLPMLALAATLLLPAAVTAQIEATEPPGSEAVAPVEDARIVELQALVPEHLAGLPLREELQLATGEQLVASMSEDERAMFEEMLAARGKSLADYAAAHAALPVTESEAVIVQVHRVGGIDAVATTDTWIDILRANTERPRIIEAIVGGREVVLVSDDARLDFPLLNVFAAGDVVWMVVADDDALVEEAVRVLSAASEPTGSEE